MANNLECQLLLLLHTQELLEVGSSISHNKKAHLYHLIVSSFFLNNVTSYMTILIIVERYATQSSLLFSKFTLHVSGVNYTHHQEYTKL